MKLSAESLGDRHAGLNPNLQGEASHYPLPPQKIPNLKTLIYDRLTLVRPSPLKWQQCLHDSAFLSLHVLCRAPLGNLRVAPPMMLVVPFLVCTRCSFRIPNIFSIEIEARRCVRFGFCRTAWSMSQCLLQHVELLLTFKTSRLLRSSCTLLRQHQVVLSLLHVPRVSTLCVGATKQKGCRSVTTGAGFH